MVITPEQNPIPIDLADYPTEAADLHIPEVQYIYANSLGDKILFENLMAIRAIWKVTAKIGETRGEPSEEAGEQLDIRFAAVIERRRQLGDIPRREE